MPTSPLIPGQHIHIIGIGGFGMSAIARVLHESGYSVTGSDRALSPLAEALQKEGVTIHVGHHAENVGLAELVLKSSAVGDDNPEVQAAQQVGVPVKERREFIATLTDEHNTIAVAGTHGKTTTTAMISHVLLEAGFDPSYIVGGIMSNTGTNAGAGLGEHFVIEADEYGHMFLGLHPQIAVVTNVEYDHPDYFRSPNELVLAFRLFLEKITPSGILITCADDTGAADIADERRKLMMPVVTYGIENKNADWWAIDLTPNGKGGTAFTVCYGATTRQGEIGRAEIQFPGRHNVANAMAAVAVGRQIGIGFDQIAEALASFNGTGRRSELMGEAAGVRVVNDYAHHPTAIRSTLNAWHEQLQGKGNLWAVWQPHTYSRTRTLADSFQESFGAAQHALITDVYAAREAFTPGLDAPDIAQRMHRAGHPDARHTGDLNSTAQVLATEVQENDVVIIMSAGDAPQIGRALLSVLEKRQ